MGNQNNHSVARKRLSTLAITTTLAAVGVGVVGTGAANAATGTPLAHSNADKLTPAAVIKVMPGTGTNSLTATADLTGTNGMPATQLGATVTVDWGDKSTPDTIKIDGTTGLPDTTKLTHTYAEAGTYNVVETVNNTKTKLLPKMTQVTVVDSTLVTSITPSSVKKDTPVTLSLKGSSVDKSILNATTTIDWGDKSGVTTLKGDPALIDPTNAKLSHSYKADGTYTVTVKLDDGLHTKNSTTTQKLTVNVGVQVLQAAGADRYETGIQISKHQWASVNDAADTREQAKAVVLSTGLAFPDALAGVPLAKKAQGPLLLTDGSQATVGANVLGEIERILPKKDTVIYILGGEQAMNAGIESQLQSLGYKTHRLAGADRFATAVQIAKVGMGDPSHIIVARGDEGDNHNGFADALSAGPYAANVFGGGDSAIVLSDYNTFDPATKAYVTSKLIAGHQDVAAVGGQAVAAMGTIRGSEGLFSWAAGKDRYDTAAQVASHFLPNGKADQVGVATGEVYADALTGGAYMATVDGPLLLTDPAALPDYTKNALSAVAGTTPEVNIFGGDMAISKTVAKAIAAVVKVTTIGKF